MDTRVWVLSNGLITSTHMTSHMTSHVMWEQGMVVGESDGTIVNRRWEQEFTCTILNQDKHYSGSSMNRRSALKVEKCAGDFDGLRFWLVFIYGFPIVWVVAVCIIKNPMVAWQPTKPLSLDHQSCQHYVITAVWCTLGTVCCLCLFCWCFKHVRCLRAYLLTPGLHRGTRYVAVLDLVVLMCWHSSCYCLLLLLFTVCQCFMFWKHINQKHS